MFKFIREKVGNFMDLLNPSTQQSTYSKFTAGGSKTLYDMLLSGDYHDELPSCILPNTVCEFSVSVGKDIVFIKNNRYYNYNDVQPRYQWIFTFSSNGKLACDLTPGYIELYPNYKILSIISTTPHGSSISIDGVYDLQSSAFNNVYELGTTIQPTTDKYGNAIQQPNDSVIKKVPVSLQPTVEMSTLFNQIKNGQISLSTSY